METCTDIYMWMAAILEAEVSRNDRWEASKSNTAHLLHILSL